MMAERRIGTMILTGEDAISFANAIYCPTREEIESHNRIINEINNNITITNDAHGFIAEICDLDLSFLESANESITIQITLSLVQLHTACYNMSEMPLSNSVKIRTKKASVYKIDTNPDEDLSLAA